MSEPVHFYHCYTGSGSVWQPIAEAHQRYLREFAGPHELVVSKVAEGFEQVTLAAMHARALTLPPDTPMLYCHTKGSWNNTAGDGTRAWWRNAMTYHCIGRWEECLEQLKTHDAVGPYWHEEPRWFAGNFWWANAGYLASLEAPDPADDDRHPAEVWVGSGNPRIFDMQPGGENGSFGPDAWYIKWDYYRRTWVQELPGAELLSSASAQRSGQTDLERAQADLTRTLELGAELTAYAVREVYK
jgi:hypothetical protein